MRQNRDVLYRRLWATDPLLLYEMVYGQKVQAGKIRKSKSKIATIAFSIRELGEDDSA